MISKEEVEKIAKLARLGLSEEEIKKMEKDLSSILDYFEKLKEVDISGVEAGSYSLFFDTAGKDCREIEKNSGVAEKIMKQAPDYKNGYFKVKAIL